MGSRKGYAAFALCVLIALLFDEGASTKPLLTFPRPPLVPVCLSPRRRCYCSLPRLRTLPLPSAAGSRPLLYQQLSRRHVCRSRSLRTSLAQLATLAGSRRSPHTDLCRCGDVHPNPGPNPGPFMGFLRRSQRLLSRQGAEARQEEELESVEESPEESVSVEEPGVNVFEPLFEDATAQAARQARFAAARNLEVSDAAFARQKQAYVTERLPVTTIQGGSGS